LAQALSFRLITHLISLLFVILALRWMWNDFSAFPALEATSMILGYVSFILIGLTLLIGPVKSWLPARLGATCLSIRRDLGIWARLTAISHVVLVLILFSGEPHLMILHQSMERQLREGWLGLFFYSQSYESGWPILRWSLIGVANYLGLIAFLMVLSLCMTSSERAVKRLGASTWRRLHLANPFLFILVVIHGLTYIQSIKGMPHTLSDILLFASAVWMVRILSYWRTSWLRQR
jgi:methionine sulfoxide reductase heme-binding subunit